MGFSEPDALKVPTGSTTSEIGPYLGGLSD